MKLNFSVSDIQADEGRRLISGKILPFDNEIGQTNVGKVKLIVIDSVNEFGGWQGSLDVAQFEWLENEIKNSDRLVVLASHHPIS